MNFASDNTAAVAPQILDAIARVNTGFAPGYGNDDATQALERQFAKLFEREVAAFLVSTGTAANALALAHLSPPWGAALCHAESHAATDEAGAPEFFGAGLKVLELPGDDGKITPDVLKAALARGRGVPHAVIPSVLSLTQATEAGTVYRIDEVAALAALAHAGGLAVHMDGARFGNALARLGVSPAEATWKAGVDVLSFGATKAGALAAEAVIFFDPARAEGMHSRRKRAGHLLSKHRYIAAQFSAYLANDLWLALARHANTAATRLSERLTAAGVKPVWPVEANEVFVLLSPAADARLRAAGAAYHAWPMETLPHGHEVEAEHKLARLVTSFVSTDAEVDAFASLAAA
jgi:threonine aldolase